MKRLFLLMLFVIAVFSAGCGESSISSPTVSTERPASQSASKEDENNPILNFAGENFSAEYKDCYEVPGVSGCFYISLQITNIGDSENVYSLNDVYVDDLHCNTGTGLPVTAAAGKKANGAFIVFYDAPLANVENVEFKLSIRDSKTYSVIEESETVTIFPNA